MIRFPDRDTTRILQFRTGSGRTGFWKYSTGSNLDIQTALITAVKCLISFFFGYKPVWIKYLNKSIGLGSDRITQWKFLTGWGLPKSPISSTLTSIQHKPQVSPLRKFYTNQKFVLLRTKHMQLRIHALCRLTNSFKRSPPWKGYAKYMHIGYRLPY